MSGFKGFALVNSKKYDSGVNGISRCDSDEPGGLLSKSRGKLGTLGGRTASVERGQSHACQILLILSDQELEAYPSTEPGSCSSSVSVCAGTSVIRPASPITFWHNPNQHIITVKSLN